MNRRNFFKVVTGFVAGVFAPRAKGSKRAPTKDEFQKALNEVVKDKLNATKAQFHTGDRVHVGDLPDYMSHFRGGGKDATVLYSNQTQDGHGIEGGKRIIYALDIDGFGHSSWYPEWLLIKIKAEAVLPWDKLGCKDCFRDCGQFDECLAALKKKVRLLSKAIGRKRSGTRLVTKDEIEALGRGDCRHSDPTLVWAKKTGELYHKTSDKMIIDALKV